jgi:hypothetical protein
MGLLDDMLKALDRLEIWKELQGAPKRIEALEKRLAEVDALLDGKAPPGYCRLCGARAARLSHNSLERNIIIERWDCADCHHSDFRYRKP